MRTRERWVGIAVLALAVAMVAPGPAMGQLTPGIHGVRAHDLFSGADGVGVRLSLGSPLPVRLAASGDWFFPQCEGRCRYQAASLDVHVPLLPVPLLNPYALGGYSWRRFEPVDATSAVTERGVGLGLGVRLGGSDFGLYLEARYEFLTSERQWVTRLGVEF